jgi:hypothetical protein
VSDEFVLAHNLKEAGGGIFSPTHSCFIGSTLVHTRTGLTAIQDIKMGDEVKTINQKDWSIEYQPVVGKYGAETHSYYKINIGHESLYSTENHRYWVDNVGWVKASELKVGNNIYSESGLQAVRAIEVILSPYPVSVYNIEVMNNEDYLVGERGYLVVDRVPSNIHKFVEQ